MIDLQAVRARAAARAAQRPTPQNASAGVANAAKAANGDVPLAKVATLATVSGQEAADSPAVLGRDDRLDAAEEARQERAAIHQFEAGMAVHEAEVAAGIKPRTAEEEMLHARRKGRALGLGLGAERADRLAERLVQRDRDGDDRRLCIECAHARVNECRVQEAYLPDVLQRCPRFESHIRTGTRACARDTAIGGAR